MAFDIKAKVEEIVKKIQADPKIAEKFKADPTKTVEEIAGVDLPDDQVKPVVDAVKAKINVDNISGALGGLGNLFKK